MSDTPDVSALVRRCTEMARVQSQDGPTFIGDLFAEAATELTRLQAALDAAEKRSEESVAERGTCWQRRTECEVKLEAAERALADATAAKDTAEAQAAAALREAVAGERQACLTIARSLRIDGEAPHAAEIIAQVIEGRAAAIEGD
jgi:hypothetical protein